MPREIHNDASDPGLVNCYRVGCDHARRKHPDGRCTGLLYGLTDAVPCECQGFVEPPPPRAPAKPLPSTVTLRAKWEGAPPRAGAVLMSSHHTTKFGYRIVDVVDKGEGRLEITAVRVPKSQIESGATIHPWKWDKRTKKETAW